MRDRAAPEIEQVRGGELPDLLVVGEDAVALDARVIVAVDHDERRALRGQLLQHVGVARGMRRREHDAVHLAAAQHLELRALLAGILAGAAQQQAVAAHAGDRLDAGDDLDEEGVHQIRDDDAEGVGAAEAQAAGDGVALVAELLDFREDAGAGGLADVVVVVEHLGDGRDRDAELAGDPLHRGRVHGRCPSLPTSSFSAKVN